MTKTHGQRAKSYTDVLEARGFCIKGLVAKNVWKLLIETINTHENSVREIELKGAMFDDLD